jgi:hypothetical protein
MANTRQEGLRYLDSVLGLPRPACVAVSKLFQPEESRTRKETWWFDLPIEKIERHPEEDYHLLGKWGRDRFVWLRVPNRFLLGNIASFDTKYRRRIRLHLAAYGENWLVDERVTDGLCFSGFEMEKPSAHKSS